MIFLKRFSRLSPVVTFAFLATGGCSSSSVSPENRTFESTASTAGYEKIIQTYTQSDKKYESFYNKYDVYVTLLNSEVQLAMLEKKNEFLQWDEQTLRREREKMFQSLSGEAQVMVSFYSPERTYDDLSQPNSIWKAYLEFEGRKYPAQISKPKLKLVQLSALLPHHDRFRTAYEVKFSIPMTQVEKGKVRFILTSSLGTSTFEFNPR